MAPKHHEIVADFGATDQRPLNNFPEGDPAPQEILLGPGYAGVPLQQACEDSSSAAAAGAHR